MKARILAAAVGLAILLPALFLGGEVAVEIIVLIALGIGLDEFARMAAPERPLATSALMVSGGGGAYAAMTWGSGELGLAVLALTGVAAFLFGLFRFPDTKRGATVALALAGGLIYLPVMLSFLPKVRAFDDGLAWLFLILVITWMGDTGAYFAGRAFGRTKLFPRVSPKKTWEGAIGGAVTSVAGACVVKAIGLPDVGWGHIVVLAVLADAGGVVGDLVESMLKRSFGVKDSGWIMPGHGGILDRIDGLLVTAPLIWVYATIFGLG
jgi:phosphatidate cytidylyltransferase